MPRWSPVAVVSAAGRRSNEADSTRAARNVLSRDRIASAIRLGEILRDLVRKPVSRASAGRRRPEQCQILGSRPDITCGADFFERFFLAKLRQLLGAVRVVRDADRTWSMRRFEAMGSCRGLPCPSDVRDNAASRACAASASPRSCHRRHQPRGHQPERAIACRHGVGPARRRHSLAGPTLAARTF